tara:strand:- start:1398 stop:1940 length:543 start_codon:yes stop_codon:yes gene_type:complete
MGHIDEMLVSKIGANRIEQNSLPVGAIVGSAVTAGTAIADSTAAVTMDSTAFGQTFTSAHNDAGSKTITLPPNVTAKDIGKSIKIYQVNLALVNTGVIVLSTGAGNSLSANSVFCGGAATVIRPAAAANNQITITGADTNSAFGPGSTITATVVAAGKYLVEIVMVPLGAGSDAIAVATA